MPATIEALAILVIFVMPGFITVRTRDSLIPRVGKPDAVQITLQSVTVSLLYVPLWILASPDLVRLRDGLASAIRSSGVLVPFDRALLVLFSLTVLLPAIVGITWAVASWNDWYAKIGAHVHPLLGLRPPNPGVGDDLWDRVWLNRSRERWLIVYMKDGRRYVGRGVEFSQSGYGRDFLLGPDTKVFKDGELIHDLGVSHGDAVWIPGAEVSSIDIHE